jgi:predicted AAA+ superfamily ATPase
MMIRRSKLDLLLERLRQFPCVAILGARQVGKTTLAREVAGGFDGTVYLDLERASDVAKLAEPELFLGPLKDRLVVLDEIQRIPGLFTALRPLIDDSPHPGRFLILGSAGPELLSQSAESLAGRIAYLELDAFSVAELKPSFAELQPLWLRGGFPRSWLAATEDESFAWRQNFIATFLERDVPQLGFRVAAPELSRLWRMLAHHHSQLLNTSQLGAALGVAHTTVRRHLDILQGALVVRMLEPLHANLGKRLVKSPKVYLRDSGLLHALLNIQTVEDLQGHPITGASWEGFVVEQIFAGLAPGADVVFYRTAAGAEIDLVVSTASRRVGFEIKFSSAPKPARGFWQALEDLKLNKTYVVAPVKDRYPIERSVEVISPLELTGTIT